MSELTFIEETNSLENPPPPTARIWAKHFFYFFLTFCTATLAGTLYPFGSAYSPLFEIEKLLNSYLAILEVPTFLFFLTIKAFWILLNDFELLKQGLTFSIPLLFILTAHEFGHYIACRIYKVDATLPYFIPVPLLSPAGTLGAFIKIQSPMPSRKAVFDIGVAGPIAGFLALIPIAIIAFLTLKFAPVQQIVETNEIPEIYFSDALFTKLLAYLFGADMSLPLYPNGFYSAVWVGLLVTSLNLIPSGQLDGGHALYAVFGKKIHAWTGKVAFVVMTLLSIIGVFVFNSPSGVLFAVLLGVMLRLGHPEPMDDSPLDFKRKVIAFITLLIFILSFVPFPIRSSVSLF